MSQKLVETVRVVTSKRVEQDRFFMPESLTPLFHTQLYPSLAVEVRRRYNQLHALYVNEQIAYFELSFAPFIEAVAWGRPELSQDLKAFVNEERRHSRMFARLNLAAAPEYYEAGSHRFVNRSYFLERAARFLMSWPRCFPVFLWLILLQEERALRYSREFARCPELDPYFQKVYGSHLEDEAQHLELDQRLLPILWEPLPYFYRQGQARLLRWLISEFLWVPKRSAPRVLEALALEFPELSEARLKLALAELAHRPEYLATLYPPTDHPLTYELLGRYPEMGCVVELLEVSDG